MESERLGITASERLGIMGSESPGITGSECHESMTNMCQGKSVG